jgi:hypothetical protein
MFSCAEVLFEESINADRGADAAPRLARSCAAERNDLIFFVEPKPNSGWRLRSAFAAATRRPEPRPVCDFARQPAGPVSHAFSGA